MSNLIDVVNKRRHYIEIGYYFTIITTLLYFTLKALTFSLSLDAQFY